MAHHLNLLLVPSIILIFTAVYYFKNLNLYSEDLLLVNPISLLIVILSITVIVRNYVCSAKKEKESCGTAPLTSERPLKTIAIYFITTMFYMISINYIGMATATFLFLIIGMYILGVRSKKVLILAGLCVSVILYLFFSYFLKVSLPEGIFF